MTSLFKKLTISSLSLIILSGIVLSVGTSEPSEFNAQATVETSRRIYVWVENEMNKDGWGDGGIYIHYWGGTASSTFASRPLMNTILGAGDFFRGLFYYDIPSDSTTFIITADQAATPPEWQQSDEVTLSATNRFKSFKLINSYGGGSHGGRPGFFETSISLGASQFVWVVSKIDSCSSDFASGFNHFKDLVRIYLFDNDSYTTSIMGSSEFNALDTTNFSDVAFGQPFSLSENRTLTISIQTKLEVLRVKYNADNGASFATLPIA
jgi:hypothetical protein